MTPVCGDPSYSELEAKVEGLRHTLATILGHTTLLLNMSGSTVPPLLLHDIRDLCFEGLAYGPLHDLPLVEGLQGTEHRGSRSVRAHPGG